MGNSAVRVSERTRLPRTRTRRFESKKIRELRFRATLREEPEIEVALVLRLGAQ